MSTVRVSVAPSVLQWALDRAGMDTALAQTRFPKLEQWLSGERHPTLKQVESFADCTHTPFGLMFLPAPPPPEALPIPDMRTPRSAGVTAPSVELTEVLHACQRRQDWYREYARSTGLVPAPLVGSAQMGEDPEEVGARLREALALDSTPRERGAGPLRKAILTALERCGFLVMITGYVGNDTSRPLDPTEFRGFSLADEVAPLIFVNGAEAVTAQNFTLVHEAAHLMLGQSALSDARPTRKAPAEEAWCNRVAGAALVPLQMLRRRPEPASASPEDAVADLARECGVSNAVVLIRLRDTGLLSQAQVEPLLADAMEPGHRPKTTRPGGDFYRTARFRLGAPFIAAVARSTQEGSTTYRDAFHLLGTRNRQVMDRMAAEVLAP